MPGADELGRRAVRGARGALPAPAGAARPARPGPAALDEGRQPLGDQRPPPPAATAPAAAVRARTRVAPRPVRSRSSGPPELDCAARDASLVVPRDTSAPRRRETDAPDDSREPLEASVHRAVTPGPVRAHEAHASTPSSPRTAAAARCGARPTSGTLYPAIHSARVLDDLGLGHVAPVAHHDDRVHGLAPFLRRDADDRDLRDRAGARRSRSRPRPSTRSRRR